MSIFPHTALSSKENRFQNLVPSFGITIKKIIKWKERTRSPLPSSKQSDAEKGPSVLEEGEIKPKSVVGAPSD